jgi:hypothetical protein
MDEIRFKDLDSLIKNRTRIEWDKRLSKKPTNLSPIFRIVRFYLAFDPDTKRLLIRLVKYIALEP